MAADNKNLRCRVLWNTTATKPPSRGAPALSHLLCLDLRKDALITKRRSIINKSGMQVSTGPLLNTENKESSEDRRTERQENEKSVWTGRSKPGVKVHLSLYITRIIINIAPILVYYSAPIAIYNYSFLAR